jgi:hypothetical protein
MSSLEGRSLLMSERDFQVFNMQFWVLSYKIFDSN